MACVTNVYHYDPGVEIIVVDDGIDFGIKGEFRQYIVDHCTIVEGMEPFVFSRNCNLGIAVAGTRDVVLLNDDALLQTPYGFSILQRLADANPKYGLIAAACNNVGNVNQNPRDVGLRPDEMVCFIAVLIPRRTIDLVGPLDERFGGSDEAGAPIYGWEDNDYCRRVRMAGLEVGIYDHCFVDHGMLPSTFRHFKGQYEALSIEPGRKVFVDKWGSEKR
jgi:GT2 family glycosyltransferase